MNKPELERQSPNDLMMHALEDFGNDEPTDVLVVFVTKGGDLEYLCTSPHFSVAVGLAETAKFWILERMRRMDDDED